MFVISKKKTIPKGMDLKIYSLAYGFLFFVISISGGRSKDGGWSRGGERPIHLICKKSPNLSPTEKSAIINTDMWDCKGASKR
jgi:hypothetical protein